MTDQESEVIILGGGCIGASIGASLMKEGYKSVQLLDFSQRSASATSASGGMLRIFHESLEHMELAHFSKKQERDFGVSSMHQEGHLYFFDQKRLAGFSGHFDWLRRQGVEFELLNSAKGRERFPTYAWKKEDWAVYEPDAGHRDPQQFTDSLLNFASKKGLMIQQQTQISKICIHLDRFRLIADEKSFSSKLVILAGGYQMLPLLQSLRLNLKLEKKEIRNFRLEVEPDQNISLQGPNYFDRESLEYARLGQNPKKILSSNCPSRIPQFKAQGPLEEKISFDAYSPARLGLLGEISGRPNLMIASGWGGTGFKFALEVGHRIAKAITHRPQNYRGQYAVLS